jgi:hypothetical protein
MNDGKFDYSVSEFDSMPFLKMPRGSVSIEANDTYIEFIDPTIEEFYDEDKNQIFSEEILCDDFVGMTDCPELKLPLRKLLYVGDVSTLYLCSTNANDTGLEVVSYCDYEPSMYVFQTVNGTIKADIFNSDEFLVPGSINLVDKTTRTFVEIQYNVDGSVYPPVMFFDENKNTVTPVNYRCGDLSTECGKYANDVVKMIDATNIKTLYVCATKEKANDLPKVYARKMLA